MARLLAVIDPNASDRSTASDDAGSGPGLWRALLAVLGIAAAGYLLLRWRRSDAATSIDALADEAKGALEDAQPIEIGEPGEDAESDEEGELEDREDESENQEDETGNRGDETGTHSDAEGEDESDDSTSLDASTTDRSSDEIAERTESDVQEEPAEPGEMTIDEEVADEILDEDENGDAA